MKNIQHTLVFRIGLLAFALLVTVTAQAAGPWFVATNGVDNGGNDGLSWDHPFATISNAIVKCSNGDTISVSNGVYALTAMVTNLNSRAKIRAASTNPADTVLLGPGSNATTYASGGFRGVYMSGSGSTLEGFTVTNFYITNDDNGAGIYCSAGLVSNCIIAGNIQGAPVNGAGAGVYLLGNGVVANCTILGNVIYPSASGSGGGVTIQGWSGDGGWIKNCRIVANSTLKYGGGVTMGGNAGIIQDSIIASNSGTTVGGIQMNGGIVSNCQVFANNSANYGGIAVMWGAVPQCSIMQCVISNNSGMIACGGLYIDYATNALISGCVIVNNRTTWGTCGGLSVANGVQNVLIRNCLVANNLGLNDHGPNYGLGGAGMYMLAPNALIENCTIASNTLISTYSPKGAGLYATNGVCVVNSIIYHNSGVTSSNVYASADCTFSNCCTAPLSAVVGTANTEADPQFVAKEIGNFRLKAGSPSINTGLNQAWMTGALDLDGRPRLDHFSRRVDMGAYEFLPAGTLFNFH